MFGEDSEFPLQFPLILQQPLMLYQEQTEGNGKWSQVKYLEIQMASKWDTSGEISGHRSSFIFNYDIFKQVDEASQLAQWRDSQISIEHSQLGNDNAINKTYDVITQRQKPLFMATKSGERSEILLTYSTDLHYCSTFDYLSKRPYSIKKPPGVRTKDYQYVFFKRSTTKKGELLIDVVGFSRKEKRLDLILAFLMKQLLYDARYSTEGIIKQVEDSVQRVFMQVLKQVMRYISKALQLNEQGKTIELTYSVLVANRDEFFRMFTPHSECALFCKNIKILKRDVTSMVYKVMITESLFPINCEINTMNDSYIKLKLMSLMTDSEVLPWSPKFHASLALSNFHYSFTPNDQFNLRTLKTRKYNQNYQYLSVRVLDFFPLDQWVELVSSFFHDNLLKIITYIGEFMSTEPVRSTIRDFDDEDEDQDNGPEVMSYYKSVRRDTIARPSEVDMISNNSFTRNMKQETEMMMDKKNSKQMEPLLSKQSISLPHEYQTTKGNDPSSPFKRLTDGSIDKIQLSLFKNLLIRSLKRVSHSTTIQGVIYKSPLIQMIKTQIAKQFQQTYRYELQVSGILTQFCQIITETELMSYSTFGNNCQTPVAAFIYTLCDAFRPFSESLDPQTQFLLRCKELGYKLGQDIDQNDPKNISMKMQSHDLTSLQGPHLSEWSNVVLSHIALDYYHSEFELQLSLYLKYASSSNLLLMGEDFIQPAVLDKALDYFGFYGDNLSADYLKNMQSINADLNSFAKPQAKGSFFARLNEEKEKSLSLIQESHFSQLVQSYETKFFSNYGEIMNKFQKFENDDMTTCLKINAMQSSMIEVQQDQQVGHKFENSQLNMHFLVIYYQNKLIQLRQMKGKNASQKHYNQQLYQEACFIYYNSIRMQLASKMRKNTLSYIGFVLAKDLDQYCNQIPENVILQTLV